ncbi:family 16 glycosylhydrolase [Kitasatospora sp. NPDC059327]|uniref:family 16 glycosylhydrolase n=1 Tax=Kitasatospora sp. NPDC059327 TaxID=3346803 RepID=UPI0036ABE454
MVAAIGWGPTPVSAAPMTVQAVNFEDNFDGPAGSAVDAGRWQTETGDNVNNHERQYYTAGNANAALDGQGHLVITARRENPANYQCWYGTCQYTSARLNTAGRFAQAYGHVETRMKVPRGQGMWPAFWMLGNDIGQVGWPNSGEIDVMENVGFEPGTVHGTIHGPGYSGSGGIGAQRWSYNAVTHDLVNVPADKCLDVAGGNPADATATQIWTCTGAGNQKWTLNP